MDPDSIDDPRTAAIEQLEAFGLSAYAARTFVALASLGTGTARDVSDVSEVPRTRVYDAIEELNERGLVDVHQSSPREYWAISADTASRTFERELQRRTAVLRRALNDVEPVERRSEQRGVWTVDGRRAIEDRILEFVATAEDEIVYMTVDDLLTGDLLEGLGEAADHDVSVTFGGMSDDVEDRLRDAVPDADTFESLWAWSDSPAGRLLLVDDRKALVSVRVNGTDAAPADQRSETAIWGEGETNSLVVVLQAMFTWRRDAADPD